MLSRKLGKCGFIWVKRANGLWAERAELQLEFCSRVGAESNVYKPTATFKFTDKESRKCHLKQSVGDESGEWELLSI